MGYKAMKPAVVLSAAALVLALAAPPSQAAPANRASAPSAAAQEGARLFHRTGCYLCHGTLGQGAYATGAPQLAPDPISLDRFRAYLRLPTGRMPPYSGAILPDRQVEQIHQYLQSIPFTPGPRQIPLLNGLLAATGGNVPSPAPAAETLAHGANVFAANCAACHGPNGSGGIIGDVRNEEQKRTVGGTARLVMEPPRGMPRLFPNQLSAADVQAVAVYLHSLSK